MLSYYLYYLSLEKCFEGFDECGIKLKWIKKKIIEEILSCLITSILIELMIYNLISKFHLIHFFIIFMLFYEYSHGMDFHDHGYFNIQGFIILFFGILIFLIPFNVFIYFTKKKKSIYIYFIFMISIFCLIYNLINSKIIKCEDWPKGLNNTYIENNTTKYGCQIIFPKECPYKIGKYFQDITKLKGINCKYFNENEKQKLLKSSKSPYIKEASKFIGYPLTNKYPICLLDLNDLDNKIKNYFLNNLVDMENKKVLNKYFTGKIPEIQIDFSNNYQGKMIINLIYNKTLSEERKLKEIKTKPYSENIIILYIDSVSRANSIRQLRKTMNFFEKFISYKGNFNKKYPSNNFHSFQFFKYHSFLYHTRDNYPLLFYGKKREEKIVLITKYLKENGYITAYCGDYCHRDNVKTKHNLTKVEVHDHQFIICDPNSKHYNSNSLRCLYGKKLSEHLYEYGNQFLRKYNNNRKFLTIITNDGHEGTLENVKYIDDIIFNFLNNLFNDNLFKDSSIFLLSDHGVGMPSIYYFYNFYKIEEQLPMLFMIINDRKNISYNAQYKYLNDNQQVFITAYDIYNTLGNIIYGDNYTYIQNKTNNKDSAKTSKGISLFNKINSKKRRPKLYYKMANNVCK